MVFGKKKGNSVEEMQNWYQDRYTSVAIQRNFLLLFSVFTAGALLLSLTVLRKLQESGAAEPYLIEYDKNTGYMTVVESKSKQEYTAQQAVKESMLMQYIYHREAPKLTTVEDDMDYVRVSTLAKIYPDYLADVGASIRTLKRAGLDAKYNVKINSIQYIAANRVQVVITKKLIADEKEMESMDYRIIVTFGFADIEMPIEDMRINPLGFQVLYYRSTPVKTFKSAIMSNSTDDNKGQNVGKHTENNSGG